MIKPLQKLTYFLFIAVFLSISHFGHGQSNPAAQTLPYTTDFSSMQNTTILPAGIAVWLTAYSNSKGAAETSVPSANAPIVATAEKQLSGSSAYNYTLGSNNRLYVQLTSNTTNGSNQIATAVNTTGKTGIRVSYDIELISNQSRSVGVTLQYRVGQSDSWTTVAGSDYSSEGVATEEAIRSFEVTLPAEAENKSLVQLRWITYEILVTGVTGSRDGIALDNLVVTDAVATPNPLTTSVASLNFGSIAAGEQSNVLSYTLTSNNLSGNVTVTAASPFMISDIETSGFIQSKTFSGAELASGKVLYVKVNTGAAGFYAGSIVHAAPNIANVNVTVSADIYSAYVQSFNNCTDGANLVGGWSHYSVTGDQTWACTTFGKDGNGVQISGYTSSSNANEDWLISPNMDFSAFNIPLLSVNHRTKYSGNDLVVKVSTNYSGTGNPAAATWANLATLTADNSDEWKLLENLSLAAYKSANTYVALVYTSTTSASARWTLDNFAVQNVESFISTNLATLRFAETAVGSVSAAQQFTFQGGGFTENLIVAAPTNFELSKDGTAFTTALTYTPAEAAANNTVYVRFKPLTAVAMNEGAVSFTSGTSPSITRGILKGSSILKSKTLDVVTWNIEWFGSTSNGPSNEVLQYENAKQVILNLNADVIGVQEIVDENKLRALATEIGYGYESMTMSWQGSSEQKVAFLYKPEVVTVKKEKVLLSKLYEDIRAGRTTLTGYPVSSSLFWASGRLPYMVQFEANIDGVKQLYNIVNFHAKANTTNPTEDYNRRVYDAQVLKDSLNAQYANANLIILGDYNDDVDVSVVGTNQPSSFNMFVSDNNYKTLTYDLSVAGAFTYESGSLKSFLDHMIVSNTLEDEYIANSIMIESQLLESIADFRSTTSDHLPVSARFYISTDNTTGIADATKGQFKVYPNPTSSYVNLVLPEKATKGNINLSVWSVDGRRVFETTANLHSANQDLNRKISNLAKGVYVIKINAGNEVYQTRLMKQ
ncbi:endonuclease/exonuclease/phosphatase family protein [Pontibacter cellulosilyticus]|uniref:T9SS type A sorting domain-containing protein n=1 Tax=Pontibacter cellulosilyticus TaxID=1720253 RepID=A0A923N8Y6_9BACT|nr:endonuclease/exonuclease/phosphatase family protein [Pontibacter cellulosilyticus]MBC5993571.1 T9SS type A sorting domain-containing protein [Pontibacter cellulosilyticus]